MRTYAIIKLLLISFLVSGCTEVFDIQLDKVKTEYIQIETEVGGNREALKETYKINPNTEIKLFAIYKAPFGKIKELDVKWNLKSNFGQIIEIPNSGVKFTSNQTGIAEVDISYEDQVIKTVYIKIVPDILISESSLTINEGDTGSITFNLNEPFIEDVSLILDTKDNTATKLKDYVLTINNIIIPAGETSKSININALSDSFYELDNETFYLKIKDAENAIFETKEIPITIVNTDTKPTLSISNTSASEDSDNTNLTVSLSYPSIETISFDYSTSNNTAIAGSDFNAVSGNLSIPPGEVQATINLSFIDDLLNEPIETFNVQITNPLNATIAIPTSTITILDNDLLPELSWSNTSLNISEGDTANITFTLSKTYPEDVSFNLSTADNTASSTIDYSVISNQLITIPAGSTSQVVTIDALTDSTYEHINEIYDLNISSLINATASTTSASVEIINTTAKPSAAITSTASAEEADGSITVAVNLSGSSTETISVDYNSANGSAIAGTDYTASNGTLSFNPGETSKDISYSIMDNSLTDADRNFTVTINNPINLTSITNSSSVLTILNDDFPYGTNGIVQLGSSTLSSATMSDYAQDVLEDIDGNLVYSSYTFSSIQETNGNNFGGDILLFKTDQNGNIDTSFGTNGFRQYGNETFGSSANGSEIGAKISQNSFGDIFVTTGTNGSFGEANGGAYDILVSKLSKDGIIDTSFGNNGLIQFGGPTLGTKSSGNDIVADILTDSNDNVYIIGHTGGTLGDTNGGSYDIFVIKITSSGSLVSNFGNNGILQFGASSSFNTSGNESATEATIDALNNIYITGFTDVALQGTTGANDGFVIKIDSNGNLDTSFAGNGVLHLGPDILGTRANGDDYPRSIKLDSSNNIFLAGGTKGSLGEAVSGSGSNDIFVLKLDSSGNIASSFANNGIRQFGNITIGAGANKADDAYDIDIDSTGAIYISGFTNGDFEESANNINYFGYDALLLKLNSSGDLDTTFEGNGIFHFGQATASARSSSASDSGSGALYKVLVSSKGHIFTYSHVNGDIAETRAGSLDLVLYRFKSTGLE